MLNTYMFYFPSFFAQLTKDPMLYSFHPYLSGNNGRGTLYYDRPAMLNSYHRLLADEGYPEMEMRSLEMPTPSMWNITENDSSSSGQFPVILNWYPNVMTIKPHMIRLGLPECITPNERSAGNSSSGNLNCDFDVNELVKVSWAGLAEVAPRIKQLLDRMKIDHKLYVKLLKNVSIFVMR